MWVTLRMMESKKSVLPTARAEHEGLAAGDDAMEDDLTEEREITPAEREDVAQTLALDP